MRQRALPAAAVCLPVPKSAGRHGLMRRHRLGNVARLGRPLPIPRVGHGSVDHEEAALRIHVVRTCLGNGILEPAGSGIVDALIRMKLVEIRVNNGARVQPQKTRVARNHALRIAARRHGGKVTGLEVLDNLGADLYSVRYLLDRHTALATASEQHLSKSGGHQNPPNSSSAASCASTASSSARPSASSRTSRGLEPSGGPTTPFSSSISIIRPARA